jgi:hypothetical protein
VARNAIAARPIPINGHHSNIGSVPIAGGAFFIAVRVIEKSAIAATGVMEADPRLRWTQVMCRSWLPPGADLPGRASDG